MAVFFFFFGQVVDPNLYMALNVQSACKVHTVKSQIFVRYLISYFRTFAKSAKFNTGRKFIFGLEAIEFQCNFVVRPSKVRKLVRTNQFQVKSTKIGTGRKFVTLQ